MRFLPLLLLVACLPASYRHARRLEGNYSVVSPGPGWSVVAPGGADHAWYHKERGATIFTDSNCGPRYRELSVDNLSMELIGGIRAVETRKQEHRMVGGREGLLRVIYGAVDGVEMLVATMVVNRDLCTFDITLITPPDQFDSGWADYERVLVGFAPR